MSAGGTARSIAPANRRSSFDTGNRAKRSPKAATNSSLASPSRSRASLAFSEPDCNRVQREVPRREVGFDPVGKRREIDRTTGVDDDPPRAVPFRQWKGGTAAATGEGAGGFGRVRARDVDVDERTAE